MNKRWVEFDGATERSGPALCGQANMVLCVPGSDPMHFNASLVWAVDAPVEKLVAAVRSMLLRHEALRTTYEVDGGTVRQIVHGAGRLPVDLVPDGDAETVRHELRSRRFDVREELPVRVAVVLDARSSPSHIVFVLCHSAVDSAGIALFAKEYAALLADEEPAAPTVQPLDLVEAESSESGRRRADAALAYWEQQLRTLPQSSLAYAGADPARTAYPRVQVRSSAAAKAVQAIAERTQASRSAVLMAAVAHLAGFVSSQQALALTSLSANRFAGNVRGLLGTLAQDALIPVTVGATFDETVANVRSKSMQAYRHGRFDAARLWDLIGEVGAEQGTAYARDLVFNDMSGVSMPGLMPPAEPGAVEPSAAQLTVWVTNLDEELDLTAWVDPAYADGAEFVRGLLRLLAGAEHRDPATGELAALTGLSPLDRGPAWARINGHWVSLPETREVIGGVLADVPHEVDIVDGRLHCRVGRPGSWTRETLHRAVVGALRGRLAAIAPTHYHFDMETGR